MNDDESSRKSFLSKKTNFAFHANQGYLNVKKTSYVNRLAFSIQMINLKFCSCRFNTSENNLTPLPSRLKEH
ncbi:CLUMA_CG016718, isoform A [Clunio marinus]|uniref:CLUMA_CG016718, isoform A n=1 Tax=Clunio marinus TaxID=568069 RepID=A0A1J1IW64_9DIPT|nr:CLUMA_CG016718, isoform A [Clunio marinus]